MRVETVVISDFYANPKAVRAYAVSQQFYTPYQTREAVIVKHEKVSWWATRFKEADVCPFKSDNRLISALETAVGEKIDLDYWRGSYPTDEDGHPITQQFATAPTCLWNGAFHVKPKIGQLLGDGVHNHVTDGWNPVDHDGWAGIIYLSPEAPIEGGLNIWKNINQNRQYDWMTTSDNWKQVDRFGNIFNRLILVRGNLPHSGADGWGESIEEGRLYQTFFFKTDGSNHVPFVPNICI